MFIEAFRMVFDRPETPRRWGVRAVLDQLFTLGVLILGSWLLRDATMGRDYPWSQGEVFFGAMALWLGVLRLKNAIGRHRRSAAQPGETTLGYLGMLLSRLLTLALLYFPGLALGWYAIEAENRPSRNSRGVDVCNTSPAQFCVSGPRALIPWAILLLVFAALATWYFLWDWRTEGGRKERPRSQATPLEDAVARVNAVIPEDDPGAAPTATYDSAPPSRPADPDFPASMDLLRDLVRMRESGAITEGEFQRLKAELIREATDGV